MKKKHIKINGKEYPCRITMGAMLRFRNETGKDVNSMKDSDITELVIFLWCCIASACAADKVEFGMSLMEFADSIDPDSVTEFYSETGQREAGASDTNSDPPTS